MIFKDYYKILDLNTSRVSLDEIKVAYRQAAKKYHPDLNVGDNLAEDRIKDINEAYRILSSPSAKRKYDRTWNAHFNKEQRKVRGKESIFDIFLGSSIKQKENEEEKQEKAVLKGENVETEIKVSIEDAFYGLEKKISLRTVDGKMKTFSVTVPEGIRNGEKIRLIGQGKKGKSSRKTEFRFSGIPESGTQRIEYRIRQEDKLPGILYPRFIKTHP